jgi:hypothetical protein
MTAAPCPTCGRRHRRRRSTAPAPMPLFEWRPPAPRPRLTGARLLLRDDLRDAEGNPRACIALPGQRHPLAFPTLAAAVAALRAMEAAQ